MRVLKVTAEGLTTSFRYPHFMQQIHPSFQMPPPATIYGHICSALGEWVDPQGIQFAYHFTYQEQVKDIEHIIVLSPARGRLPGSRVPKVLEGRINPFEREILFHPRLTLYLNRPEWESAFRSPRYAVVLGRSQDLFTYTRVEVVELEQSPRAYFEHTLLPHTMVLQTMQGVTVLMPRYLDYARGRVPAFDRYIIIKERVYLPPEEDQYRFSHLTYGPYWVDPTTPEEKGAQRGVMFLTFTGEEHAQHTLA
ncbi:MAG: type I-B CRISPR-associated protein Cas5 [Nitrospinota bacterium]|nr:MAG: type I-B CRISPR-associated protein Cas5 [Nitrospinota bacterium]